MDSQKVQNTHPCLSSH